MQKHYILPFLLLTALGSGCSINSSLPSAPILGQTPAIVSAETAAASPLESMGQATVAMPCLQFTNREGFLRWLEAYISGNETTAKGMAQNIDLPSVPDLALTDALKESQPSDATKTGVCTVHKLLGLRTWAVQKDRSVSVSSYYKGNIKTLDIAIDSKGSQAYCLPKTVTDQELIWVCRPDMKASNWSQVHVNRRSGEMKAIRCETLKDGATVQPGTGCLR